MSPPFIAVIRAAIAVQVATLELADEDMLGQIALPALERCVAELVSAAKALRKYVK